MKRGFGSVITISAFLVFLILGGLVYWFFTEYIRPNVNLGRGNVAKTDAGIEWLGYENERYNFNLIYPNDTLFLVDKTNDDGLNVLISEEDCSNSISDCGQFNSLRLRSYASEGLTLSKWVGTYLGFDDSGLTVRDVDEASQCLQKAKFDRFMAKGHEFYTYTFNYFPAASGAICTKTNKYDESNNKTWKKAYFKEGEVILSFDIRYTRGSANDAAFKRILESFEFNK